jgi:hypothetical protein
MDAPIAGTNVLTSEAIAAAPAVPLGPRGFRGVLGETIGPGSYVHIPAHVVHDIDATATEGCTMFYLYLRPSA